MEEVGQTGGTETRGTLHSMKYDSSALSTACFHTNLTEGMLLACVSVLSISRCDRNMLRSPFSMYSVTMHSGSDDTHTHSSRMMLGSFRRDMIFISFRKSFLMDRGEEAH